MDSDSIRAGPPTVAYTSSSFPDFFYRWNRPNTFVLELSQWRRQMCGLMYQSALLQVYREAYDSNLNGSHSSVDVGDSQSPVHIVFHASCIILNTQRYHFYMWQ